MMFRIHKISPIVAGVLFVLALGVLTGNTAQAARPYFSWRAGISLGDLKAKQFSSVIRVNEATIYETSNGRNDTLVNKNNVVRIGTIHLKKKALESKTQRVYVGRSPITLEILNKETGEILFRAKATVSVIENSKSKNSRLVFGKLSGITVNNVIGSKTLDQMARRSVGGFEMSLGSFLGSPSRGGVAEGKAWVSTPEPSVTSLAFWGVLPIGGWILLWRIRRTKTT